MEASPLIPAYGLYSKKYMNAIKIYNAPPEHHRSAGMLRITGISPNIGGLGLLWVVIGLYGVYRGVMYGFGLGSVWYGLLPWYMDALYI